jgi:hypothetical protein
MDAVNDDDDDDDLSSGSMWSLSNCGKSLNDVMGMNRVVETIAHLALRSHSFIHPSIHPSTQNYFVHFTTKVSHPLISTTNRVSNTSSAMLAAHTSRAVKQQFRAVPRGARALSRNVIVGEDKNLVPIRTNLRGSALLNTPALNKGAGFSREER